MVESGVGTLEGGCQHPIERQPTRRVEWLSRTSVQVTIELVHVARVGKVFGVNIVEWCGDGIHGRQTGSNLFRGVLEVRGDRTQVDWLGELGKRAFLDLLTMGRLNHARGRQSRWLWTI